MGGYIVLGLSAAENGPKKVQKKFAGKKKMLTFAIPFEKRGTEEIIEKTGKYK